MYEVLEKETIGKYIESLLVDCVMWGSLFLSFLFFLVL